MVMSLNCVGYDHLDNVNLLKCYNGFEMRKMMVTQHCEYTKCHWMAHFKMINYILILPQ